VLRPVTTVSSEDFVHAGITPVEDLLDYLPQIVPELTSNELNGATGTTIVITALVR
jgi:hypothetical protein